MNSPSEAVKTLLTQADLGLTFATNLFIGREPATPDNCVTIFDTPGGPPTVFYNNLLKVSYPSIQIRIRNSSYSAGWELAKKIKDLLHNQGNIRINNDDYLLIKCTQEPALLDWDESNRARFVVSFDLIRGEV